MEEETHQSQPSHDDEEEGRSDWETNERRRFRRVDKVTSAEITSLDNWTLPDGLFIGRSINISVGGLRLELTNYYPLPLQLNSVLEINLVLGRDTVEVKGKIVYMQVLDKEKCVMGIRLMEISREAAEKLKAFIDSESS